VPDFERISKKIVEDRQTEPPPMKKQHTEEEEVKVCSDEKKDENGEGEKMKEVEVEKKLEGGEALKEENKVEGSEVEKGVIGDDDVGKRMTEGKNGGDVKRDGRRDNGKEREKRRGGEPRPAKPEMTFYNIKIKCKGLLFIKINPLFKSLIDPYVVCGAILNEVHEKKENLTRYCHRMIPVEVACPSEKPIIEKHLHEIVERHFPANEDEKVSV
jgi:hypothetical protein